jgi:EGF domain
MLRWILVMLVVAVDVGEGLVRGHSIDNHFAAHELCDPNHAVCFNGPGATWFCVCHKGFEDYFVPHAIYGFYGADIDECTVINGGCRAIALCINTDGSRTCICKEGISGDGLHVKILTSVN